MDLQIETICIEIVNLQKQHQKRILKVLMHYNPELVKKFPDGSRIDLDLVPKQVINTLYSKINYFLKLDNE